MTDFQEWDVFGSDDDESSSSSKEDDAHATVLRSSFDLEAVTSAMERVSEVIVTTATQRFIKQNHDIKMSQRYFGLQLGPICQTENDALKFLNCRLLFKIEKRCMISITKVQGEACSVDGASISGRFVYHEDGSLVQTKDNMEDQSDSFFRKILVLGGILFVTMIIEHENRPVAEKEWHAMELLKEWKINESGSIFTDHVWDLEHAEMIYALNDVTTTSSGSKSIYTILVRKRPCTINTHSCVWKTNHKRVPHSFHSEEEMKDETWIDFERRILASATVSQSAHEKNVGFLTQKSIENAVKALQVHGFVVLPGLFHHSQEQVNAIKKWSDAVLEDFDRAAQILKEKHNVDILNPGSGSDPLSYREMAMREDFRVDLRDGPSIRAIRKEMECVDERVLNDLGFKSVDRGVAEGGTAPVVIDVVNNSSGGDVLSCNHTQEKQNLESLRYNPFVLDIVRKLLNPHSISKDPAVHELYKGNFGRWNFSGSGPNGSPQPLRVGQIGSVISLPGAADQCIHADTPHLFEMHDCLPCHYANLFIYGEDKNKMISHHDDEISSFDCDGNFTGLNTVGGTGFVDGSHRLSVTARLTAENGISAAGEQENIQNEMHLRIIRPSLQLGDAVIFDTRTLHFGLANRSNSGKYPGQSGLRRPMLYVNMTHSWFFDPKNWDNKQSIF